MAARGQKEISDAQWAEWVTMAEAGDAAAFEELYKASENLLRYECKKVLNNNKQDVEDVMQDVYLIIYRSLIGDGRKPLTDGKKFLSWARTIAHNESVNFLTKTTRNGNREWIMPNMSDEEHAGLDAISAERGSTIESPEEEVARKEEARLIQEAIDSLTDRQRECFVLSQDEELKSDEIAEILHISPVTVRTQTYNAKRALQRKFEKIEKREGIALHGFSIVPTLGGYIVKLEEHDKKANNSSWIGAEEVSVDTQEILKTAGKAGSGIASGKVVTGIVALIAVVAIAVGIGISTNHRNNTPNTNTLFNTTITETNTVTEAENQSQMREIIRTTREIANSRNVTNLQNSTRMSSTLETPETTREFQTTTRPTMSSVM